MYKEFPFSATQVRRVVIIKTSSLGDIVHSFPVLNALSKKFPGVAIDWVVEESLEPIVAAHPLVHQTLPFDMKGLKKNWFRWSAWKKLARSILKMREQKYDLLFDLQANSKSGAITSFAKASLKVGFGFRSVREWPNVLATDVRFEVPKRLNIRLQHLHLLEQFFGEGPSPPIPHHQGVRFKITPEEQQMLEAICTSKELAFPYKIMVCPGSKWVNKQIPQETLSALLEKIGAHLDASFLLVWGQEEERVYCEAVRQHLPLRSRLSERLSIPAWQNLMSEVDLVLAVDSSALHLCGTTSTPSFSIFGPTNAEVFKPMGPHHFSYQGSCPYGKSFAKTCPILRTCPTGACIRQLTAEELFAAFSTWSKIFL